MCMCVLCACFVRVYVCQRVYMCVVRVFANLMSFNFNVIWIIVYKKGIFDE